MDLDRYDRVIRLLYAAQRILATRADLIIANSMAGREELLSHGVPAAKVIVISNGIDTSKFKPDSHQRQLQRARWGIREDEKVVGLVARLEPMKDHRTFLKAASVISARSFGNSLRFVCIGDGPREYRQSLQEFAQVLRLGERQFGSTGLLGMAGLEAMAVGRAVIARIHRVLLESAIGGTLPVLSAENPVEVADQLIHLRDRSYREGLGRASREFVEQHCTPAAAAEKCLQRLFGKPHTMPSREQSGVNANSDFRESRPLSRSDPRI